MKIPHTTQHRIVNNYQLPEPKVSKRAKSLSVLKDLSTELSGTSRIVGDTASHIDGGTVRLRTPQGYPSEWKNYQAVKLHDRLGMAFFQDNHNLVNWVNRQPLSRSLTCLGDGHDGVWNIIKQIGICIGSGSVESWIKQIASRIKIIGSQWNQNNVSQMLKLRCTYLNGDIALGIST